MLDKLALIWYSEELKANSQLSTLCPKELQPKPPIWFELTERRRDEIRARVSLVLEGEVRRSEMTAGDLAVYRGRIRCIETRPPRPKEWGNGYKGLQITEYRRFNHWDSLCLREAQHYTYLFGNANIGNLNDCSLQIAGGLCSPAVFSWIYIELPIEGLNNKEMEKLLQNSVATLNIGDHPVFNRRLIDLIEPVQIGDLHLPHRQNFSVRIDFFNSMLKDLSKGLLFKDPEFEPKLYVHLEGMEARDVQ